MGQLIGGLVPTFLLSRLFLWLMKSWDGGVQRILVAHGVSLLASSFVGGIGMADGGAFAGVTAFALYTLPQAFWLIVDLVRFNRAPQVATPSSTNSQVHGATLAANKSDESANGRLITGIVVIAISFIVAFFFMYRATTSSY